jgi:hypothetical protein
MKFIVELKLKPGGTNRLLEHFDIRGPNRHPYCANRTLRPFKPANCGCRSGHGA